MRKALTLLPALALAATMAGCAEEVAPGGQSQAGDEVKLVEDGVLTTCTHLPYPPFQFTQNGKIVGFDVDLIDLVAKELGVKQKIFDTPFEGIQSGESFNVGDCDVAAAAMTIKPEREKVMDFSDPYFDANQSLLVKKGSGIDSLEDLRGKVLGAQLGTTGLQYAEENKDKYGYTVRQFEDIALEQTAVKTEQVAAGINDVAPNTDFAAKNPDVEITQQLQTGEKYGFAVRTGNGALLAKINEVIARVKADGTYDRLYEKWFGNQQGQPQ